MLNDGKAATEQFTHMSITEAWRKAFPLGAQHHDRGARDNFSIAEKHPASFAKKKEVL